MWKIKLKKWFKRLALTVLVLFVIFLLLDRLYPLPLEEFNKRSFAQIVVDKDGHILRAFPDSNGIWRYPVSITEVSPLYLEALIQYEDRYFYKHFGVNPLAVLRAFGQWIWHREAVSGASTLTMQVARILKPHKKTLSGKIQQMFMALQLEWHLSKDEILEYYLNYAPFGGTVEGIQAASFTYLGKNANELTHSEAALLAVMPQSPSRFRPDKYPQKAETARNKLLNRLKEQNIWSEKIINGAIQEPVHSELNRNPMLSPHLSRRLAQQFHQQQIIHSTIDIKLQTELEILVKNYIESISEKLSASVLMIDNETLNTLTYIGSADFFSHNRNGYVDMIQSVRSPGSTLKPFIYGIALDEGIIHSQSLLFDVPQSFEGYRPKNFDNMFHGAVSTTQALLRSLNMPAVQVLNEISSEKFYAKMINAGLNLSLPDSAKPNLSIALGGGGVNMQELAGLFSSLGRNGKSGKIRFTVDDEFTEYPVLSESSAWVIQNILSQSSLEPINSRQFKSHDDIAFKTGTSYGSRDSWVIAVNKKVTIAIWLGHADGAPVENNSGRQTAVPLLQRIYSILPEQYKQNIEQPLNVRSEVICWPLGTKLASQRKKYCHIQKQAFLIDDLAPPTLNSNSNNAEDSIIYVQTDKATGFRVLPHCQPESIETKEYVVWPRILEPWIPKPLRRNTYLPTYSDKCKTIQVTNSLEIRGIHDNSVLFPEAYSSSMPGVMLESLGSNGKNYWFVNGKLQNENDSKLLLSELKSGSYKVTLIDDSANFAEIEFSVKL